MSEIWRFHVRLVIVIVIIIQPQDPSYGAHAVSSTPCRSRVRVGSFGVSRSSMTLLLSAHFYSTKIGG